MDTHDPTKVVIEIDMAGLWLGEDGRTFAEYVANAAARQLLDRATESRSAFDRRVTAIRDEEVRALLRPILEEAMNESLQPTDSFGNPRGEPTTLQSVVIAEAKKQLTEKPYSHGQRKLSFVEEVIREQVERVLGGELRAAVDAAKRDVLAAVQEKAGEIIAETVDRVRTGRL